MNLLLKLTLVSLAVVTSCKPAGNRNIVSRDTVERPNVILIMTDDQGWYDAGFNGNTVIRTPNLDHLAAQGIILDRFYSASAVCSPTRASAITGRNPLRMNIPYANAGHMIEEEITLPEILKKEGYRTGHFGKWHLGTLTKLTRDANRGGREENAEHFSIPSMHGYDEFFCTESKVPTHDPMWIPVEFEEGESTRYGWNAIEENEPAKEYGTAYWNGTELKDSSNLAGDDARVIMDRVFPFIQKSVDKGSPFFTTVWLHTPHLPVVADSIHRQYYSTLTPHEQIYFGSISAMDEQIGLLWSFLEELEIHENTIIWFCSDNGPENNTPGSAGIFRERKRSLYEGGVRVPAFIVWKNHFRKEIRMDFPSVTSDYLPTILDILDIDFTDDRPIDGESILKLLEGERDEREKEIGFIFREKISWVSKQYKLISTNNGDSFELFDLLNDKGEEKNIIQQRPDIAQAMKKGLFEWKKSVKASQEGLDYR